MRIPLSILDLAPIARGETASDSFAGSVALAQRAEELGYLRVWYAEHHNMASIASSATSVLIAHIGAQTQTIRLGSGGVMRQSSSRAWSSQSNRVFTWKVLEASGSRTKWSSRPGAPSN